MVAGLILERFAKLQPAWALKSWCELKIVGKTSKWPYGSNAFEQAKLKKRFEKDLDSNAPTHYGRLMAVDNGHRLSPALRKSPSKSDLQN